MPSIRASFSARSCGFRANDSLASYRPLHVTTADHWRKPMLALRFYAPGDVRLEDVPEPDCGPREVKIKVKNCSTCGTDVKIRANGHVNITGTTTMGHERSE